MITMLFILMAQALFASILILTKKPLQLSDKILSFALALVAMSGLLHIVAEYTQDKFILRWFSRLVFTYLFPLVLYFYAKYLTGGIKKIIARDFVHVLPLALIVAVFFTIYALYTPVEVPGKLNPRRLYTIILYLLAFFFSSVFYGVRSFNTLHAYIKRSNDSHASVQNRTNFHWVQRIFFYFYAIYALLIVAVMFRLFGSFPLKFGHSYVIALTLFIYIFSFIGFKQGRLMLLPGGDSNDVAEESDNKIRYQKSGLKTEEAEGYKNDLFQFMKEEKPWLDPNLTITNVSEKLNIPKHYITQILNDQLNKNFYNFVNEYRIEEAMKMLKQKRYNHFTIVAIANECGFNSKSSFNTFFKKYTGSTPSAYRKALQLVQDSA